MLSPDWPVEEFLEVECLSLNDLAVQMEGEHCIAGLAAELVVEHNLDDLPEEDIGLEPAVAVVEVDNGLVELYRLVFLPQITSQHN
jgi:hypothetical protein